MASGPAKLADTDVAVAEPALVTVRVLFVELAPTTTFPKPYVGPSEIERVAVGEGLEDELGEELGWAFGAKIFRAGCLGDRRQATQNTNRKIDNSAASRFMGSWAKAKL